MSDRQPHPLPIVTSRNTQQDYSQALKRLIRSAPQELEQDVLQLLSIPQTTFLTEEYAASPVKIMVMGRETYGEENALADLYDPNGNHDDAAFDAFLSQSRAAFDFNDFGSGYEHYRFWQAYEDVRRLFELPSKRCIAWSNLSKVQLLAPARKGYCIDGLPPVKTMPIVRWQRDIAKAEMELLQPDIIVMFTSDMTWMAEHLYGDREDRTSPRQVRYEMIDNLPNTSRKVLLPDYPEIVATYTYHPNVYGNLRQKAGGEQAVVFDYLRREADRILSSRI